MTRADLVARVHAMRAQTPPVSYSQIAQTLGLTKGVVIGMARTPEAKARYNRASYAKVKAQIAARNTSKRSSDNGSWDTRLFETWTQRKARRAEEAGL